MFKSPTFQDMFYCSFNSYRSISWQISMKIPNPFHKISVYQIPSSKSICPLHKSDKRVISFLFQGSLIYCSLISYISFLKIKDSKEQKTEIKGLNRFNIFHYIVVCSNILQMTLKLVLFMKQIDMNASAI